LKYIDEERVQIINSFAIEYEISKVSDTDRELKIREYLNSASEYIEFNSKIERRATELEKLGFNGIDATHIAVAEYAQVDYFITCDDDILKLALKCAGKIKVDVISIS
jgi:predicted nucleic acid-binding protein